MPDQTQLIGIIAGICTAISLLPQLFKIIKEKNSEDISSFMLFIVINRLGRLGMVWPVEGRLPDHYCQFLFFPGECGNYFFYYPVSLKVIHSHVSLFSASTGFVCDDTFKR